MRARSSSLAVVAVGLISLVPLPAAAIPVFARKYGFNCTMCHSNTPRLNDFGQRYRMNGYRLPGREDAEKTVLESFAPLALRANAGFNGESHNDAAGQADLAALQLSALDLLSAGVLGHNVGYFMVYVPQMAASRGVVGQDGSLEMASVVFSGLGSTWLNLRVGRYEPAYVAFSVKRQLSVSPYEVYATTFPGGPAFSESQTGLELSGWGRERLAYAAGIVTGSETNHAEDTPTDAYARATYVFGGGEGQTAGQRFGVVGYLGRARPASGPTTSLQTFSRAGAEASLNAAHFGLALQYLFGRDDPTLWQESADKDNVTWSGGFAELSYLPRVDLVGFARYDYVDAPSIDNRDIQRGTVGGRYYFEDNVAVHLEYSYRFVKSVTAAVGDAKSSYMTARLDVAF